MGSLYIRGALFASNHEIELDIYAPVGSSLPPLTKMYDVTDKNGSFLDVYTACSNYVMEVQAIDTQTNTVVTTYGVPGCIG